MALALPWEVTRVATAMPSLRDWVFQDEKCLGGACSRRLHAWLSNAIAPRFRSNPMNDQAHPGVKHPRRECRPRAFILHPPGLPPKTAAGGARWR
jgi:hypothetical protein